MKTKNMFYFVFCLVLMILGILFIQYRDNQIARTYDGEKIISKDGYVTNIIEEKGEFVEIVGVRNYDHRIMVRCDKPIHEVGDMVVVYSLAPNFDCHHYSTIELVKHETNMVRYYPLFIIPGIGALMFGLKLIEIKREDDFDEDEDCDY